MLGSVGQTDRVGLEAVLDGHLTSAEHRQPPEGVLSFPLWVLSAGSSEALPSSPLFLVVSRNPEEPPSGVTQASTCPLTT